nr:hypothetical protein 143p2_00047 [Serratia proteamaculans]
MPTVKSWVAPWALSLVLTAPGVFAAPVADIPAAPLATPLAEKSVKPPTSADIPLPTTFTRTEAGRALNLGQLEAIQAETVLYEAQLARAKALNELQKNGYDRAWISLSIRHRLLRTIRLRSRGHSRCCSATNRGDHRYRQGVYGRAGSQQRQSGHGAVREPHSGYGIRR